MSDEIFNPHGDKTLDGVLITKGMYVWDYNLDLCRVVKDHTGSGYQHESGYCNNGHWYDLDVVTRENGASYMDASRMWVRHPGTSQRAEVAASQIKPPVNPRVAELLDQVTISDMFLVVQPDDLRAVATLVAEHYGMSYDEAKGYSLLESMTDEFGWTSSGEAPVVMWEEGPDSWAMDIPETVREYLKARHLFSEPARSWVLAIYPV